MNDRYKLDSIPKNWQEIGLKTGERLDTDISTGSPTQSATYCYQPYKQDMV